MGSTNKNWIDAGAAADFERQIHALEEDLVARISEEPASVRSRRRHNLVRFSLSG
jgi:hypothetical protein